MSCQTRLRPNDLRVKSCEMLERNWRGAEKCNETVVQVNPVLKHLCQCLSLCEKDCVRARHATCSRFTMFAVGTCSLTISRVKLNQRLHLSQSFLSELRSTVDQDCALILRSKLNRDRLLFGESFEVSGRCSKPGCPETTRLKRLRFGRELHQSFPMSDASPVLFNSYRACWRCRDSSRRSVKNDSIRQ